MKISELRSDDPSGCYRTFIFNDEGHTLGNSLRCIISRYPDVEMCSYTIPHPAESKMNFRIQTRGPSALDILKRGLKDLEKLCDHTLDLFEKEVKEYSRKTYFILFYL